MQSFEFFAQELFREALHQYQQLWEDFEDGMFKIDLSQYLREEFDPSPGGEDDGAGESIYTTALLNGNNNNLLSLQNLNNKTTASHHVVVNMNDDDDDNDDDHFDDDSYYQKQKYNNSNSNISLQSAGAGATSSALGVNMNMFSSQGDREERGLRRKSGGETLLQLTPDMVHTDETGKKYYQGEDGNRIYLLPPAKYQNDEAPSAAADTGKTSNPLE